MGEAPELRAQDVQARGWRELIDFEALQLLRDERDREREREREELARRLREEAALRALEAAEEERRRRASRELLQQQREEWEADQRRKTAEKVRRQNEAEARSEQELAAHRRMTQLYATESQKQLAAKRAREKREADLAARRQARLDKKLRLLEKLTKIKGRPSNISLTSWLGRNPEYVPHSQWPPLKPDQKREKVVNCRSGLDKDAKVEASFVQQKAIVPAAAVLPQQPPQRQMMVRVVRPEVIIRPVSPSPKPPPNSRPNTAHTAARELLAVGINSSSGDLRPRTPTRLPELSLGDGLPNATPITKSWSNLRKKQAGAAIVTLGRSASAASLDQPVKGTVPFTSPGLLTPAQKKAHARKTGPITRGSTGDCGRLLSETMEGGQAHLLPVADIIDLQIVLVLAGIECYSWADGRLVELLDELTSLDACFNSVKSETLRPSHNAAPWEEDPFPLCPHLLLKRKVLYVHVLSDCGELELMQRIEANDGRVEHRRICARALPTAWRPHALRSRSLPRRSASRRTLFGSSMRTRSSRRAIRRRARTPPFYASTSSTSYGSTSRGCRKSTASARREPIGRGSLPPSAAARIDCAIRRGRRARASRPSRRSIGRPRGLLRARSRACCATRTWTAGRLSTVYDR